jgi:hypothetical protein
VPPVALLTNILNRADYPVYRVDVDLSTGQSFSYAMIFNSGLPAQADDAAVMACATTLKNLDWGTVAGNPPGTTATAVRVTRAVEQQNQRTV